MPTSRCVFSWGKSNGTCTPIRAMIKSVSGRGEGISLAQSPPQPDQRQNPAPARLTGDFRYYQRAGVSAGPLPTDLPRQGSKGSPPTNPPIAARRASFQPAIPSFYDVQ